MKHYGVTRGKISCNNKHDLRQMGDYRELVTISIDQADEILEYAKEFLVKVKNLLKEILTDYE